MEESPVGTESLMESVVERQNLLAALKQVKSNKGSPGIDGMSVEELPSFLKEHWSRLRKELLTGRYHPRPVKRVEIPKPGGGKRKLGIPTVLDRFIQQALMQVLQRDWDPTFSASSYGFRPGRSAHQAVAKAQEYVRKGYRWVVDIDLEQFFDRVNHDKLMGKVRKRVKDPRVIGLIHNYLKAGVMEKGLVKPTDEGTPQGGSLSPLLSNLVLDELDQELERRGHCFVRYADDDNVYVRSVRAGERVMASLSRFITRKLKLKVNESKSAVDRACKRTFLGFTLSWHRSPNRRISEKAIKRFKETIRLQTRRTRGRKMERVVRELRRYLNGWGNYFGYCESRSILKELDSWVRRRLRCYLWKQWGRRGYRELVKRGISRDLAWNTAKSAHGPWRLSRSPALAIALPGVYFEALGLPRLYVRPVNCDLLSRTAVVRDPYARWCDRESP